MFREEKWLASFNFIKLGRMQQSRQPIKLIMSLLQWMAKAPWQLSQSQSNDVHALASTVIQREIAESKHKRNKDEITEDNFDEMFA
jgi:hypothetical protein